MGALKKAIDVICLAYFIIHIPTTILVDSQAICPPSWYPSWARETLSWHIKTNKDYLMRDTPIWFMSFVWAENLVQLPFFFVATYAYLKKANWIRIPAIIYGSHVATTLVAILADIIHGQHNAPLAAIYSPYLVVPVLLTLRMALDPQPFGPAAPAASATAGGSKPKRA